MIKIINFLSRLPTFMQKRAKAKTTSISLNYTKKILRYMGGPANRTLIKKILT